MSMQAMRENTKTILWIVVIAFIVTIFAVWGMDLNTPSGQKDPNLIGKVDGVSITRPQFQQVYDQMLKSISADNTGKDIAYAQREMILDQAWNNIVYSIITKNAIENLGIGATEEEIMYYLRNTPPPEIQQYFLDDKGDFDIQSYQTALNNPEINWTSLKNLARDRIPMTKLQTYLQSLVHVSDAEVKRAYEEENTVLSAVYVGFPLADIELAGYSPTSDEIKAYYDSHIDRYTNPEKAVIEVASFDIKPAARDYDGAKFTIDLVRDQLLAGEDFASIAETYSEAPTAGAGGNTDYIKPGQREEEVFSSLEKLQKGDISEPIKTSAGYYLIKLLDKKNENGSEPEFKLQEVFIKISAGYETIDSLQAAAQDLLDRARESDLKTAAEKLNIGIKKPAPFPRNYPVEGFGFAPKLSQFAFDAEPGAISDVMRDDKRFYVAALIERFPEAPKALDEIRDVIASGVLSEKRQSTCHAKALSFYNAAEAQSFEQAARAAGLHVKTIEDFHVSDNLESFGSYSALATAVFSVSEGTLTPPVMDKDTFYVALLTKRKPFDSEDYSSKMKTLGEKLYQEKTQRYISYWYDKIQKNSKIEDYRQ